MNRHENTPDAPRCPRCGYDLTGTRRAGLEQCPECGGTLAQARSRLARIRRALDRADVVVTALAILLVLLVLIALAVAWWS